MGRPTHLPDTFVFKIILVLLPDYRNLTSWICKRYFMTFLKAIIILYPYGSRPLSGSQVFNKTMLTRLTLDLMLI